MGCRKEYEAPVPYNFSNLTGSGKFSTAIRQSINGVYTVTDGSDKFGAQVVLRWTYTHTGADTSHHLSVFTSNVGYFDMEPQPQTGGLAVGGYWRRLQDTEIGLVQLTVNVRRSGAVSPFTGRLSTGDTLVVSGVYGDGDVTPTKRLTMTYARPLNARPFSVLAHRSGGRTSDLLPASENSVEIIKMASRLGATGIEIDVRYTKDGVPILYHDNTLNLRLIQKNGLAGPIEEYTYQQLNTLVRLVNGERIPTLEEALQTVVDNTDLSFVWLDTKYVRSMTQVQSIQRTYLQRAKAAGRSLQIVIGLPSDDAVSLYRDLPEKSNTPVLCELDTSITRSINANIWAPRWTLGDQTAEVNAMKAEGRTVFVWTLDEPQFIREFIDQTRFDGILSNYACVVAYYHYSQQ
ncbi:glycerophosphodiester phosphodiesterase [Spirosoma rhododendri]|uniref:Glycerophosphodiester phosphodiesterase n=2 Tax=Spirosoma rhododendri TaxID=2728024 RepID=A0A7L5DRX2_9BACT|nr:glycerophosphodiester phosphodiesterase family protein [Spirosoma rhododendri]QJD81244.1 glycerophosphodiester phosphodiesterase [Spirosoma rhododendri]